MNGHYGQIKHSAGSYNEIISKLDYISEVFVKNMQNIGGHLENLSARVHALEERRTLARSSSGNSSEALDKCLQRIEGRLDQLFAKVEAIESKKCQSGDMNNKNGCDEEVSRITSNHKWTSTSHPNPINSTNSPMHENSEESATLPKAYQKSSSQTPRPRPKSRLAARLGLSKENQKANNADEEPAKIAAGSAPPADTKYTSKPPAPSKNSELPLSSMKTPERISEIPRLGSKSAVQFRFGEAVSDGAQRKIETRRMEEKELSIPRPSVKKEDAASFRLIFGFNNRNIYNFATNPRVYKYLEETYKVNLEFSDSYEEEEQQILCVGKRADVINCVWELHQIMRDSDKKIYRHIVEISKSLSKSLAQWTKEDIVKFAVEYRTFIDLRRGGVGRLLSFNYSSFQLAKDYLITRYGTL